MIKLLFLDFDGVLNTPRTWGKFYIDDGSQAVDPERVALVNKIVDATGAKVVISSKWRRSKTLGELDSLLKKQGATFDVYGTTPYDRHSTRRGEIIQFVRYLKRAEITTGNMVIIDDDSDASIAGCFVQTNLDGDEGLTEKLADEAILILNKEP